MRPIAILLATIAMAAPAAAQNAPRVTTTLPAAELAALEQLRKEVWVNWFAGDTAALRRVLGPELVAISPDEPHWQSLTQSLAGAAGYKASGGRLLSAAFDSTTIHRIGDVIVMFSHYALEMENSGTRATQRGLATEVFVKHNGRWVHTSWHLDARD